MKICMIGEIANCAYHLTSGLTRKGHEVHVLLDTTRKQSIFLFNSGKPPGSKLYWIRPAPIKPRGLGLFFPMFLRILKIRPQIIHAQYLWTYFFIGFIAAKILRVPIVGTGHGWDVIDVPRSPIRGKIQQMLLKRADMIVLTAKYYHKFLENLVSPERRIYIPRMIDTDMFRPGINAEDIIQKYGNNIVTFVARLFKIKTPYKTLKAFRIALDDFPDAQLLILGVGPEEERMKRMVKDLHMEENVYFLGQVPNTKVPRYLNASKVEVRGFNPQTPELGISHLEALATGTPVLTYNDYPNVIGMIICLKVEEIALALKKILGNPELQQKLGKAARTYVMKNFSIEAGTEQTLQIYQKLLHRYELQRGEK